jgi:hypothetical protein
MTVSARNKASLYSRLVPQETRRKRIKAKKAILFISILFVCECKDIQFYANHQNNKYTKVHKEMNDKLFVMISKADGLFEVRD